MTDFVFKLFPSLKRDKDSIKQYNNAIDKALELQQQGLKQEALDIYIDLYQKLKENNLEEKLALVINNTIVIKRDLNQDTKELYEELHQLRLKLMNKEENYAIDYINTILMGVDWFGLPKSELEKASKILQRYKQFPFYKPTLDKINQLKQT